MDDQGLRESEVVHHFWLVRPEDHVVGPDFPEDQSWRAQRAAAREGFGLFLGIVAWILVVVWALKLVLTSWLV